MEAGDRGVNGPTAPGPVEQELSLQRGNEVGCDFGIDSNAVEDRCGVCLGDNTSCETVYRTYNEQEGFGYVDVGVIPEGARDILVKEAEEAGNFLALRSVGSDEYFLNGNFIIQWNGEYEAGGTTFYYERSGNMENLTAPGPTNQPVMLQVGSSFHRNG
ncbi:A disintegrin and metalloproteinase with thrombospondin motifs 7 [Goodea atripinnis]|uniref:A disintegrin and metalloproteinase with thrombospondin motifs 7 n=1 Tax=Goodea atripinnis TaxID=208336 RepID=A0ABV0NQT4_9TELE